MQVSHLRKEERLGLGIAIAAHIALVAVLLLQPATRKLVPPPQRMTVSLAQDVALVSAAPSPARDAQASVAPVLSETPAPPEFVEPAPVPVPQRRDIALPKPKVQPTPPRTSAPPRDKPRSTTGGSRLGDNFLEGTGSTAGPPGAVPASRIGAAEQASLGQAINRQIKPHWTAPQGPDAELLVTVLAWDLNEDGTLSGRPRVVSQTGINDTNRAQAARHAEQAIRAVQLAAPFDLPPKYYNGWKRIREWRFDRKLSQ